MLVYVVGYWSLILLEKFGRLEIFLLEGERVGGVIRYFLLIVVCGLCLWYIWFVVCKL